MSVKDELPAQLVDAVRGIDDYDTFRDLLDVLREAWYTTEDREEIAQTIRELIWPETIGPIRWKNPRQRKAEE